MTVQREIYLDNCATTRVDEDIARLASEIMLNSYGNPSSLHKKGLEAQLALDSARGQAASALGCEPEDLIFTSGGTEANNLAILGGASARRRSGNTVVTAAWEHSSVLESMKELESRGFRLKLVNPSPDGHIGAEKLAEAVDEDTILISCALVNSEVGAIADIAGLVRLVRRKNPKTFIHCDAVQGLGKLPFSAKKLDVDTLSVSGHKIHAPKGVGALYLKRSARILPAAFGGGQEKKLRPGTEAVPLIAAFGLAAEKAASDLSENFTKISSLHEYFVNKSQAIGRLCTNSPVDSTPYVCNVSLPGYRSEVLLHYLAARGIYVSSGSACSAGKASHVLAAMGLPRERVDGALRISFSKYNDKSDIDAFFDALSHAVKEIEA